MVRMATSMILIHPVSSWSAQGPEPEPEPDEEEDLHNARLSRAFATFDIPSPDTPLRHRSSRFCRSWRL